MDPVLNRRQFLGAASAGLTLTMAGRSARAAGANDRIVVGVMGMGGRGTSLATTFEQQPNVDVAYVCDPDRSRADRAVAAVEKVASGDKPQGVTDFRRILEDKDVDVLVIATCNHWHAPVAILGCSAGKHVYVEKPCSHNAREGELMVQAARRYNRRVQMGNQRRSWPKVQEAMERLRGGEIGRVYYAQAWYTNERQTIGRGKAVAPPAGLHYDLWQGPAPRKPFRDNYLHYNWHWFWHWGNGELGNNGVHTLDLCRWGLNADYPARVTSSGGRYHFDDDQETPDTHTVCFDFEGKRSITWEGLSCNKHRAGFVHFYGTQGSLELDSNGNHTVFDADDKVVDRAENSSLGEIEHLVNFLEAIRGGKPLELNAEIEKGYKSTLLCHLGNIAHRVGRTLNCDTTNGHILHDEEAMALWGREYAKGWEPKV